MTKSSLLHSSSFWKRLSLFLGAGAALSVWYLWPLVTNLNSRLTSHDDGLLIGWTVNWVSKALTEGQDVYQAPFLHPFPSTLAFSQLFLSTGVLNVPFFWAGVPLVAAENIHFILGSICMFAAMAMLAWDLTKSYSGSLLAGLIFVFSPLHLEFIVHLHIYLLAGLPVLVWALLRVTHAHERHKVGLSWIMAAAFLYQALNDPHGAFYAAVIVTTILATQSTVRSQLARSWRVLALPCIFTGLVVGLCYLPYLDVSRTYDYTRSIDDTAHFSHSINRLWQADILGLFALTFVLWLLRQPGGSLSTRTWIVITALGLILMLGPVLKCSDHTVKIADIPIPLPYALAYYAVPGFQAMRAATRWLVVANFGLAMLASILLAQSRLTSRQRWGTVVLVAVFCWQVGKPLVQTYATPRGVPSIYAVVANRPESVLAEFPLLHWDMPPHSSLEAERLLFQSHHAKTLFNGITGFTPPERLDETTWHWQQFPSAKSLDRLREQGVELLLVHFDQYEHMRRVGYKYGRLSPPDAAELRAALSQQPGLTQITCQENACLYAL